MQHVTGQGIRSRNDRDPGVVKCLEQAQHRRECFLIGGLFAFRDFERTAQHRAPNLWRKTRHDLFEAGRDHGWIAAKQAFKRVHGRIEHGVMLFQEADELAHLGFVRRKFACVLGDFDKAIAIARFLDFRKEKIQFDKIKMLDFIRASLRRIDALT